MIRDQAWPLRRILKGERPRKRAYRIAITSGKGGVGKSNLALNLGLTLVELGLKVLLVDADLNLANIDTLLGLNPRHSLKDVISGRKSPREILIKGPLGIKILPSHSGSLETIDPPPGIEKRIVETFNGEFDLILMDSPSGLSRRVLELASFADLILVVTTPEPTAITDAYAVIKVVSQYEIGGEIKLVINLASSPSEAQEVFDKLSMVIDRFLRIDVGNLGYVLRDSKVPKAVEEQIPYIISFPSSKASTCTRLIGKRIYHQISQKGEF